MSAMPDLETEDFLPKPHPLIGKLVWIYGREKTFPRILGQAVVLFWIDPVFIGIRETYDGQETWIPVNLIGSIQEYVK